jgi:hypothetical protein
MLCELDQVYLSSGFCKGKGDSLWIGMKEREELGMQALESGRLRFAVSFTSSTLSSRAEKATK